jgi:DNA-directed RNA polymerase subunit delta
MNNTKNDVNSQITRMKALMKFGVNEGKNIAYTGVEYEKVGADGKMYGIVREGSKYYIKTSPNKKGKIAENYDYIGGFRNRKDNEYSSFAEAQKQFDLKMMSINEANTPDKKVVVESWNPDKQEMLTVEATNKMKKEISRERQIMMNASRINEKKEQNLKPICKTGCDECGTCEGDNCSCDPEKNGYDFKNAQKPKNSFKVAKHQEGDAKKANKGYKNVKVQEAADRLAWHTTGQDAKGNMADTYLDKSHGTTIGSSSPFDDATADNIDAKAKSPVTSTSKMRNGVVKESDSLVYDDEDTIDSPKPGTSKVGDSAPFDARKKDIHEDIDDIDDDSDVEDGYDDNGVDGDYDDNDVDGGYDDGEVADDYDDNAVDDGYDSDEDDYDSDYDADEDDFDDEDGATDPDIADLQDQVFDLNKKLDAIMDAVGADEPTVDTDKYQDDDLYGDEDTDDYEDDDTDVYESKSYRKMRMNEARRARMNRRLYESDMKPFSDGNRVPRGNMNTLHDFGKHPAYQKKVMNLPPKDMQEFPGYYDMNDDSVRSDAPYGQKIGDGAPFEVDVDEIQNAIAESIKRHLGKKFIR